MRLFGTFPSVLIALLVMVPAGFAQADPAALGIWLTEPDKKGQTAHVHAVNCGGAVCGTIVRAFDSAGNEIVTPAVGRQIFWDMTPLGAGSYEGQAFVPAHKRNYRAKMKVSGRQMRVRGCLGPVCMSQTWTRIR